MRLAGAYDQGMADAKTPGAAQAPAAPAPAPGQAPAAQQPPAGEGQAGWIERAGTIVMCAALAGLAVVLLDVALKGRLLGPLLGRLPAPKASTTEGDGVDTPGTAGE